MLQYFLSGFFINYRHLQLDGTERVWHVCYIFGNYQILFRSWYLNFWSLVHLAGNFGNSLQNLRQLATFLPSSASSIQWILHLTFPFCHLPWGFCSYLSSSGTHLKSEIMCGDWTFTVLWTFRANTWLYLAVPVSLPPSAPVLSVLTNLPLHSSREN